MVCVLVVVDRIAQTEANARTSELSGTPIAGWEAGTYDKNGIGCEPTEQSLFSILNEEGKIISCSRTQ